MSTESKASESSSSEEMLTDEDKEIQEKIKQLENNVVQCKKETTRIDRELSEARDKYYQTMEKSRQAHIEHTDAIAQIFNVVSQIQRNHIAFLQKSKQS